MNRDRFPYQCYKILRRLDETGRNTWATKINSYYLHMDLDMFG